MPTSTTFKLQLDNLLFFELVCYTAIFNLNIYIMQRLITVIVDTTQLIQNPNDPFSINEVDSVNDLLAAGWEIEEWDFLKEDTGDGQIVLLVTLNDDMMFGDEESDLEDDFDFDDGEDDEEDDGEEEEIEEEKKL